VLLAVDTVLADQSPTRCSQREHNTARLVSVSWANWHRWNMEVEISP